MVHSEATLKNLNKADLVQMVLNLESKNSEVGELTKQIKELLNEFRKVQVVEVVKNVNTKLVDQLIETERQCWLNSQYSRKDCLEIVGIPISVEDNELEGKILNLFDKIGVVVTESGIQASHRLKDKTRSIVNFGSRKDCFKVLSAKMKIKDLNMEELGFGSSTKIYVNESLCPYYRRIWNECKKLKLQKRLSEYFTMAGIVRIRTQEKGPLIQISHLIDLKDLFPDISFERY